MRQHAGFTFIELVVVMILVGIMSAVILPRFSLMTGFKDAGYRDEIKATLDYARKIAVAQRRYSCVVIGADSKLTLTVELTTPNLHAGSCPAAASATYPALNLPSGGNTLSPPGNVTITAPTLPLTIYFNAQGEPQPSTFTSTILRIADSSSGSTSTLTIEAESGYVH